MGFAVHAPEQAAGTILHSIARRVADGRLGRLDHKLQFASGAATVLSIAAAVGTELVATKMQWEADLLHFQAAELDPSSRLPLAGARPAVAGRRAAAAGTRLEQMPDERLAGARVDALDGHSEAPAPTRHRAAGTRRRKCTDDCLDDLLAAVVGAERHRGAGPRPHDGS